MTPVPSFPVFARLYRLLSGRRRTLLAVTLVLIAAAGLAVRNLELREDIESMLPDDDSNVARDFRSLQSAPFTRKIVITLTGGPGTETAALAAAADRLAGALLSPEIGKVATGPAGLAGGGFASWLVGSLPGLATEGDLANLEGRIAGDAVGSRLRDNRDRLLSLEGLALKGTIRADPLSFHELVLEKMRFLNLVPGMRVSEGHFVSPDGKSALLVADTSVPVTDARGGARLLEHISKQVKAAVPGDIRASVVCGHRYSVANATTIQRDLYVILSLASLAVLAIYVFHLRSLSAVYVFLVPGAALIFASGAIALLSDNVSALTLGFGGVLLGIADEYAMHVYFSCRKGGGGDTAAVVGEISRPILFGGAATLASFAVMLLSRLPGQRQLAVYAMTGILASLAISLVVLPHLIRPAKLPERPSRFGGKPLPATARVWVVAAWVLLLSACLWQSTKVRFNGDLRALGLVPPELREAERQLAETWGDVRGKAILFAEGKDLDAALAVNDRLFRALSGTIPEGQLVSLAPVLPSPETREANLRRWSEFWRGGRAERLAAELRRAGASLGFADDAFAGFLETLARPPKGGSVDDLRAAGMGDLVDSLVLREPGSVRVMTLVPDTPGAAASAAGLQGGIPGVRLVSPTRFGDDIGRAIRREFLSYIVLTSLLVLALVVAVFRRPRRILLALVPVVTGLVSMLGIMGTLGIEFNIFNIVATVLIIGLCVDYGIYIVCKLTEGLEHAAERAVLASGLTTLAGFGSLVFARHPAMHSIGVTVLLGIGFGIASALLVIPALHGGGEG
ncbi:MAG: exporter [Deltaproteobacteria bacterium]|nr:exporter [Deltaproteobacteria bacterium]